MKLAHLQRPLRSDVLSRKVKEGREKGRGLLIARTGKPRKESREGDPAPRVPTPVSGGKATACICQTRHLRKAKPRGRDCLLVALLGSHWVNSNRLCQ